MEEVFLGKQKKSIVEVINKSEISVCPTFYLEPKLSAVTLAPAKPTRLKPNQTIRLTVTFRPDDVVKGIKQEVLFHSTEIS